MNTNHVRRAFLSVFSVPPWCSHFFPLGFRPSRFLAFCLFAACALIGLAALCLKSTAGPPPPAKTKCFGKLIGLKAEKLDEYKRLHANVWPAIDKKIFDCNIRKMSIFLCRLPDGKQYLFMYFEYVGQDLEADMQNMAADPLTRKWWKLTDPCQEPLADRKPGEWWADMEEVWQQN